MILPDTIAKITEACRIEDVVGDFVALKRRGVNLIGLCPFHGEKTPSFNVNPTRNIFKCFGCGEAGDSLAFVMKHETMSYVEALKWLAKKYKIEVEEVKPSQEFINQQQEFDSLYLINEFALQYFKKQLSETDYGKSVALSYFKERGFNDSTIEKWGLGFAPEGNEGLTGAAQKAGYKIEFLRKAGVTIQSGDRDFLRNRVVFPIHNLSGKVAAFAGRILTNDKKQPKYLNTSESEIYHKSKILYGAFFARTAIRKADECLLTEGYIDVITLHQAGIENVVASSGTSLTVEQISLIKRFSSNLTLLYDGDAAGIKAALRGVDLAIEQDLNVRIVVFPDGDDPDSYLRKVGSSAFEEFIKKEKKDFILFKTGLLVEETKSDPLKKSEVIRDIVGTISKMPDAIKRSVFIKNCAVLLDVEEAALLNEMNKLIGVWVEKKQAEALKKTAPKQYDDSPPFPDIEYPEGVTGPIDGNFDMPVSKPTKLSDEFQERDVIRALMEFGELKIDSEMSVVEFILVEVASMLEEFDNQQYAAILQEALTIVQSGKIPHLDHWIRHTDESIAKLAIGFSTQPDEYSANWATRFDVYLNQKHPQQNHINDVQSAIARFKLAKINRLVKKNQEQMKALSASEMDGMMLLLKVHKRLDEMRAEIGKLLGTVVLKN